MTTNEADWPTEQRTHPPGAAIDEIVRYHLQIRDEEGRWMPFGAVKDDRDEMTRVQVDRARRFPEEKRRILTETTQIQVNEVEGGGEGETSRDELLKRNEVATARLLKADEAKRKILRSGKTLTETLGSVE